MVRRLEDSGAAAIVMHSLFEEQISSERREAHLVESHEESFAEAVSYTPDVGIFALGPDEYLEQIQRIRRAVSVPVIASLNGTTPDSWIEYARLIEQAGAHALEINVYYLATDPLEEWRGRGDAHPRDGRRGQGRRLDSRSRSSFRRSSPPSRIWPTSSTKPAPTGS